MKRLILFSIVLNAFLVLTSTAASQSLGERFPTLTEVGAGVGLDLLARGPWISYHWRTSPLKRVALATGASAIYEYIVEPWNGMANASNGSDFRLRLGGTLLAELVIYFFERRE